MTWLDSVVSWLSTVLLSMATVLLLEELTYGGLVRLLLALRPKTGKQASPGNQHGETK